MPQPPVSCTTLHCLLHATAVALCTPLCWQSSWLPISSSRWRPTNCSFFVRPLLTLTRQDQERHDKQQAQTSAIMLKQANDGLTTDLALRDQIIASLKDEVGGWRGCVLACLQVRFLYTSHEAPCDCGVYLEPGA